MPRFVCINILFNSTAFFQIFISLILTYKYLWCFTRIYDFIWLQNNYYLISSSGNDFFLPEVCMLFHFHRTYCSWYVFGCFNRCDFYFWLWNKYLLYVQFIAWFFPCSDLYVGSFHLNYCSWYVCCCFYKMFLICL